VDIREEESVRAAVAQTVGLFGGVDILVNNASAIRLTGTLDTPVKRYDLMHGVNSRGTFVCTQACPPHLLDSSNPRILTLSPPLVSDAKWFENFPACAIAKYTMSLFTLTLAGEFKDRGVAVNSLWPRTAIATAAARNEIGGADMVAVCRKPEIVADAAHFILTRLAKEWSGNFFLDDEILLAAGVRDFAQYDVQAGAALQAEFL
jgi:citronellol/citronellal dehydrogenase